MGYDKNDTETPNYVVEEMENTIDSLRAEVVSLKEQNARLVNVIQMPEAGDDLTQQLAAANERIKELEEEVAKWSRNAWE